MRLHHDKMAIAAKFLEEVPNWIRQNLERRGCSGN